MRPVCTFLAAICLTACAAPGAELPELRRIVTIENADGDVQVLADDAGTNYRDPMAVVRGHGRSSRAADRWSGHAGSDAASARPRPSSA